MPPFLAAFLVCQVLMPLAAHRRGWSPAGLFGLAAILHLVFVGVSAVWLRVTLARLQDAAQGVGDTYVIQPLSGTSPAYVVVMAVFAVILWAQTRFGAMVYPRATKVLFWGLHLAILTREVLVRALWSVLPAPRRYIDYPEVMETVARVLSWNMTAIFVVAAAILALTVWSSVAVWRAGRSG